MDEENELNPRMEIKKEGEEETAIEESGWYAVGVAVFAIFAIAAVIWGFSKVIPLAIDWFGNRGNEEEVACVFDPENTAYDAEAVFAFCTEKGFEPQDDSVAIESLESACIDNGYYAVSDVLQDTCDAFCTSGWTSPDSCTYRPPEGTEPDTLHNYLTDADDIIDVMGMFLGKVDIMIQMYYEAGNMQSERRKMINDPQYKIAVKNAHRDATNIFDDVLGIWPPPPYDSSNPLLDSQARLAYAAALIIQVDALLWEFEVSGEYDQWNDIQRIFYSIQNNMDYAEIGLSMAR